MNRVTVMGRLGRDPEIRYTQEGTPIANFNLAVDESYKNRDGEKVEKTEWIKCVVFGKIAESVVTRFLAKGCRALVEGQLQTRKFQDQEGNDRYTTEVKVRNVQVIDFADSGSGSGATGPEGAPGGDIGDDAPF